jgi:phosphoglycerate dehydrogenase-like enzyme
MAMLHWSIGLDQMRAGFSPATWPSVYRARVPHREIASQTLVLLGFGRIGRAIAQRAKAVGMRVIAVDPAAGAGDGLAEAVLPPSRLYEALAQADFFAIACPLTDATRGMVGPAELAALPAHGVLINVSRAEIAEEHALFAALQDHRIAGAYLDVWYRYPGATDTDAAPSTLPFLDLPNVVGTPHSSAWTLDLFERRYAVIADNINRLQAGQPLRNVVRAARPPNVAA